MDIGRRNRSILLFMLSYCCFLVMEASPVDVGRARNAALAFYTNRYPQCKGMELQADLVFTQTADINDAAVAVCYVFNMSKGFVVVSADDRVEPVLGYSDRGSFSVQHLPSNVRYFMNRYAAEIKTLIQEDILLPSRWEEKSYTQGKQDTVIVGQLLTTQWSQGDFYNDMCPADTAGPNGHTVTGCVATAMAQIIRYFQYPTVGEGEHGYDCNFIVMGGDNYGYLYANFGATTYDYANMPDSLTENSTPEQVAAVATLMYHCGVSVNMMYGPDGSGAIGLNAVNALKNYFRYSEDVNLALKYRYSWPEWKALIKGELNSLAPVLYSGVDDEGGHAFVCDGYTSDDYFHINWGWAGKCDGYYKLHLLNPEEYNFSSNEDIIYNIRTKESVGVEELGSFDVTIYPNPAKDNVTIVSKQNPITAVLLFDICGNLLEAIPANDNTVKVNISQLAAGTYLLRIYDKSGMSVRKLMKN